MKTDQLDLFWRGLSALQLRLLLILSSITYPSFSGLDVEFSDSLKHLAHFQSKEPKAEGEDMPVIEVKLWKENHQKP